MRKATCSCMTCRSLDVSLEPVGVPSTMAMKHKVHRWTYVMMTKWHLTELVIAYYKKTVLLIFGPHHKRDARRQLVAHLRNLGCHLRAYTAPSQCTGPSLQCSAGTSQRGRATALSRFLSGRTAPTSCVEQLPPCRPLASRPSVRLEKRSESSFVTLQGVGAPVRRPRL